jgi:predicted kinase
MMGRIRPRLFILAGIPGCGKSTWARTFFEPRLIVSTDAIREVKWPGEPYKAERNDEVFREFHTRIDFLLRHDNDAVADATSLASAARYELLRTAHLREVEAHLVFFDNPSQALRRNAQCEGYALVPEDAQQGMLKKYQQARCDILDEKYASVTIIAGTQ